MVPAATAWAFADPSRAAEGTDFFPYLAEIQPPHEFYAEVLAVLLPEATRCKCAAEVSLFSLRAPPAV